MWNYFLIREWKEADMDFVVYTEEQLRKLHRNLGHTSVRDIEALLKTEEEEN